MATVLEMFFIEDTEKTVRDLPLLISDGEGEKPSFERPFASLLCLSDFISPIQERAELIAYDRPNSTAQYGADRVLESCKNLGDREMASDIATLLSKI